MKLSMKKMALIGLTTLVAQFASAEAKFEAGTYNLDPMHSKVGFEIAHLVFSSVEGKFTKFEGTIDLAEKFEKSKVSASVDIASIDTSVKDRDDHLKSPDFFDVAKYPQMTFKSSSITGKAESFKMTGDLTIHGKTQKVTFEGKMLGSGKDAYGNLKTGFHATAKINRKDFGLTWNKLVEAGPAVGDEVTLDLKIQAAKKK